MRVLKFIGLKIAEISGLVLFVEGNYRFWAWINIEGHPDFIEMTIISQYVLAQLLTMITFLLLGLLIFGLIELVKLNWKWAE